MTRRIAASMMFVDGMNGRSGVRGYDRARIAGDLRRVRRLGFDAIDPTDCWMDFGSFTQGELAEFRSLVADHGVSVTSLSVGSRRSVIDVDDGPENLARTHDLVDVARGVDACVLNIGFMPPLTREQRSAQWFWLAPGRKDSTGLFELAVTRIRELGRHAAEVGIELSLEMYEDTLLGDVDAALSFVEAVDMDNVGLNPDLGNIVRLHRPIGDPVSEYAALMPRSNFWHIKNYTRDHDPATGAYATAPASLKHGYINYRIVIENALRTGFNGDFCCEHYGGDSLGIMAENRAYIESIVDEWDGD